MKNKILYPVFLAIWLLSCAVGVQAGPAMNQLKQDIDAYKRAQAVNPERIIRYSDEEGQVARTLLQPQRIQLVVAEAYEEINGAEKLKAVLEELKPVIAGYEQAFKQLHGKYDQEYIDVYEVLCRMMLGAIKPLQNAKLDEIKDENVRQMAEAAVKMASALPGMMLKNLEKNIEAGRFSSSFVPTANARLEALRVAFKSN